MSIASLLVVEVMTIFRRYLKFKPVVPERRVKKQRLFSLSSISNESSHQHINKPSLFYTKSFILYYKTLNKYPLEEQIILAFSIH